MNLISELIKYMMIFLIGIYTYYSFNVFRFKSKRHQSKTYAMLTVVTFLLHFIGHFTLFMQSINSGQYSIVMAEKGQQPSGAGLILNNKLFYLYCAEVVLFVLVLALYRIIYPKISRLLLHNMLMLLTVGFLIQTRLSFSKALRHVVIVGAVFLVSLAVPQIIRRVGSLKYYGWLYGGVGIALLLVVLIAGTTSHGATNWLDLGGIISVQPSEVVKLLFVFSVAGLLGEGRNFKRVVLISLLAGATVILLVLQKDLGGALIFFITYIFMLYAATAKPLYLISGLAAGSGAAYLAYQVFGHVRVRVLAWKDPFSYIDNEGYQITQSLFAIGTGGWFGMGLNRGLPTGIPVVGSDFIFSAISEELGGLFAICILLIYASCFVMFLNIALEQEELFYRLIAVGFSVMFAFQIVLCIGGVIKFIPSTGVTLPLISLGGSSMLSVIVMFMILQGVSLAGRDAVREERKQEEGTGQ